MPHQLCEVGRFAAFINSAVSSLHQFACVITICSLADALNPLDPSLTELMAQVSTDNDPEPPTMTKLPKDTTSIPNFLVQGIELQNLQ